MRQTAFPFSQQYVETHPRQAPARGARLLVRLFKARFDPSPTDDERTAERCAEIQAELDDRAGGDPEPRRGPDLPHARRRHRGDAAHERVPPRPTTAASAMSSRSSSTRQRCPTFRCRGRCSRSGCARRVSRACTCAAGASPAAASAGATVARTSAPRSSGLMKAQMVKNAVIVPVGSKGGFVVKRPPRHRWPTRRSRRGGRRLLQRLHRRPARRHRQHRRRRRRAAARHRALRRRRSVPRRRRRQGHRDVQRHRQRHRRAIRRSGSATRSRPAAASATTTR